MRTTLPSGRPVEMARPDTAPSRSLVIIPDVAGLRPLFDSLCARLAGEHGWAVAAIEPWAGREDLSLPERLESAATLDDAVVLGDAVAAAEICGVEPAAVMGFCMGGMFALKAAGAGRFDRAVSFYGMVRVPDAWRSATQGEPLDALAGPGDVADVLAICGTADPWLPPDDIDALEATGATVVRYEGADHGFVHDPSRPTHRAADAADAWGRVTTFLG